ncbi:prealbumin-like fold domain-containing protein [Listeria seeligeri]|uniref:prealbumin-like fold domain-containing protein n=1 Tax=Listeria seeligeri TaxID=1640 RepID=UPI00188934BF|nr:prealbumin-like fold domain-containing protein [Listeria seeligeri]MBF2480201.1 prealbumin-like fold domain-containing protein [Listeria seeligeri]
MKGCTNRGIREQDGKSEFSTDKSGEFTIGDYELVEIIAPTNYQLINKPILITIDGTHDGMVEVKILNKNYLSLLRLLKVVNDYQILEIIIVG